MNFVAASFSAELAFRSVNLCWFAAPLSQRAMMPVLIFTIFRRNGMRQADFIGLN